MNEPDDEVELSLLKEAISRYLIQHPQAADTVDGVYHWWLAESGINAPREKVLQALESLVEAGVIEKSSMRDGKVIYALAPRKH